MCRYTGPTRPRLLGEGRAGEGLMVCSLEPVIVAVAGRSLLLPKQSIATDSDWAELEEGMQMGVFPQMLSKNGTLGFIVQ